MKNTILPTCCSPLSDHWPFPHALPTVRLISTRFDLARLAPADFERCAVPAVKGVAKRQAEYLAGRVCAREALSQLNGTGGVPASGADRAPQWPAGTLGSITHSHDFAAAVVSNAEQWLGIGIDAETLLAESRALRLAGEILTADELLRLQDLPKEQHALRISLTFSAKESLFKALYPQVLKRFWFHDAELLSVDKEQRISLRLLIDLDEKWPKGSIVTGQYCQLDNYLLTLVAIPR